MLAEVIREYNWHVMDTAHDYAAKAAKFIEGRLKQAILTRGKATLLVSGGSSPKAVYDVLSHSDIAWNKVTVSLVDERWVAEGEAGSNASFIKNSLLQNKASAATFVPMVNEARSAKEGEATINERFIKHFSDPVDACLMGMGTDGHTASWFPQSPTLDMALDINSEALVVWQDARDQKGASGFPDRITVTLPMVMRSRDVVLLIPGSAKIQVWENSAFYDVAERPVKSLRAAGARLHVYTHETA